MAFRKEEKEICSYFIELIELLIEIEEETLFPELFELIIIILFISFYKLLSSSRFLSSSLSCSS
jgi:hypothetical protein